MESNFRGWPVFKAFAVRKMSPNFGAQLLKLKYVPICTVATLELLSGYGHNERESMSETERNTYVQCTYTLSLVDDTCTCCSSAAAPVSACVTAYFTE